MAPLASTDSAHDSDTRSKRRHETSSQGLPSDPAAHLPVRGPVQSISSAAAASQRPSPADGAVNKRLKTAASASDLKKPVAAKGKAGNTGASRNPITLDDEPSESAVESDGDEGVSAVKASARSAAELAGVQGANGRRARFAQRFAGLTPEETLG